MKLRWIKRETRRAGGSESGQAVLEFALCISLLTVTLVCMVDYAWMIQQAMLVAEAASAGAAYGAIAGNQEDFTGMKNAARTANTASGLPGFMVNASNVFSCTAGGTSVPSLPKCSNGYGTPIDYVVVQTSATVNPLLSWAGVSSGTVTGSASFRVPWTQ